MKPCPGKVLRKRASGFIAVGILLVGLTGACSAAPVATPVAATISPSPTAAVGLEEQYIRVVADASRSVVAIQAGSALGSGVIFDGQGDIVTNAHVVAGATSYRVFLAGGQSYDARLLGSFAADDLAVLKISAPGLKAAKFGNSDRLRVGSIVMAIGSPLGLQGSVTEGIVSAVGRQVSEPSGVVLPPLIQTSAAVNPGNSGGALVDLDAEVIGITTLAAQDPIAGGTVPGIGFAVPSNITSDIAAQLIANGRVTNSHRAYLGLQAATVAADQGNGTGAGVLVYSLVPGGPADKAGVRANDVITSLAGRPVTDQASLSSTLASLQPGQTVQMDVTRSDGTPTRLSITLGELPG